MGAPAYFKVAGQDAVEASVSQKYDSALNKMVPKKRAALTEKLAAGEMVYVEAQKLDGDNLYSNNTDQASGSAELCTGETAVS
jgi:hypothetical protein